MVERSSQLIEKIKSNDNDDPYGNVVVCERGADVAPLAIKVRKSDIIVKINLKNNFLKWIHKCNFLNFFCLYQLNIYSYV